MNNANRGSEPIVYVNTEGATLNIEGMLAVAEMTRRPKPKNEGPAEYHKGWRVQGHPPGAMEAAQTEAEKLCREWGELTEHEKAQAIREGARAPVAWNESLWRRETRKKPVRSKPYEVSEAARLCADMATKAGWIDVEVAELKKSKAGA